MGIELNWFLPNHGDGRHLIDGAGTSAQPDAQRRGHTVVCVTGRREPPDFSREPRMPDSVPIVCVGPEVLKRPAAAKAGYPIDIWIDDMPGVIHLLRHDDMAAMIVREHDGALVSPEQE